jgi:hypothetical protein
LTIVTVIIIKKSFISALSTTIGGQVVPLDFSVISPDGANEVLAAVGDVLTDDKVCVNAACSYWLSRTD